MTVLAASSWTAVWDMPWARAVAGLVVLCILIAVGFYVVSRYRDYAAKERHPPRFDDSKLLEMLRQGDISEAEFRTIQSKSHGVSVVTGDPKSPLTSLLPLATPAGVLVSPGEDGAVDASRDDEEKRPSSFLPPSTT